MATVQLRCDRCGRHYQGERPRFWVERSGKDVVWASRACESCEPTVQAEDEAFKERTKLKYNPRGRGRAKPTTVDVDPKPEGSGFFPKEEDDDDVPFKIPPGGVDDDKDRYWQ